MRVIQHWKASRAEKIVLDTFKITVPSVTIFLMYIRSDTFGTMMVAFYPKLDIVTE